MRGDPQGLEVLRPRLGGVSGAGEGLAEVGAGDEVVGRHGHRVAEKRHGVVPVSYIMIRREGAADQGRRGGGREQTAPALRHRRAQCPEQRELQAQPGQVEVAVGQRLRAHLHDARHRQEQAEEP